MLRIDYLDFFTCCFIPSRYELATVFFLSDLTVKKPDYDENTFTVLIYTLFPRYIISVSDHIHTDDAIKQSKTFEQCQATAYSKSENAVEAAMVNSYFAAKKDMATVLFQN